MSQTRTINSILMTPPKVISTSVSEHSAHQTLFTSNYYKCDPLHSPYSCFACLKRKKGGGVKMTRAKPRSLGFARTDEVIIKPWHPFLRVLQGFFKNDKARILERYQGAEDNKLVIEFIQCTVLL